MFRNLSSKLLQESLFIERSSFTKDIGYIPQKLVTKIHQIDMKEKFHSTHNEIDNVSYKEPSEHNLLLEEEEEINDANLIPNGLIVVGVWSFVLSFEVSKSIG